MIDTVLSFVAPHPCCGCGRIGGLLCDNCKYNIVNERELLCAACKRPTGASGRCNSCRAPYDRIWYVGERRDGLQRLIGLYKFERARSAYRTLGDLILTQLPNLPSDTVVVPVPTLAAHVRERGYDHTLLIARYVAKKRGLRLDSVIGRRGGTTQRHTTAKQREQQAKTAFEAKGYLRPDVPYLLIDDVVTTGATIKYASEALKRIGAKDVWVAVVAYQTLD